MWPAGMRCVVDMDLEKFFDRVNHDVLMARVARKVGDKRVLRLVRRYLQAGLMLGGIETPRGEGTPQGGPLSPLLSNILLDDLDKELERRGHAFCRYADDCNVYVRSQAAGERVMASLTRFLPERLQLTVNRAQERASHRPWNGEFLGYSYDDRKAAALRVAPKSRGAIQGRKLQTIAPGTRTQHRLTPSSISRLRARLDRILPARQVDGHLRGPRRVGCGADCAACCGASGSGLAPRARRLMHRGASAKRRKRCSRGASRCLPLAARRQASKPAQPRSCRRHDSQPADEQQRRTA